MTEEQLEIIENELEESFKSFFFFSLDLVKNLSEANNNLKFAVVNMHTALELFLKFYFVKKGEPDFVITIKNNKITYKDFGVVLSKFYSSADFSMAKKKHLISVLESRNAIVHQGKYNKWDENLANDLITCTLFIQGVYNKEFCETLIETEYNFDDNEFSKNEVWKKGSGIFAENLSKLNNENVFECIFCFSRAMVNKTHFNLDLYDEGGFQCLTCLKDLTLEHQIGLIKCFCNSNSFIIDILNEQKNQNYNGCCLDCGEKSFVRKCYKCEILYFEFLNKKEYKINDKYYCSVECCNKE